MSTGDVKRISGMDHWISELFHTPTFIRPKAQQNQQRSNIVRGPPLIPPHRPPTEPRPVECNLCHRKFKNVPALNGHMRLHGGYFKKEAESKKLEKKEASGPPLQTASVSVRALIEEKIISRRAAPPASSNSEPQSPVALTSSSSGTLSTSFVAPAPPATATSPVTTVSTATTVTQEFLTPLRTSTATQNQKDGTLIELLKRGSKVAVKRSASDPGHQSPGPVLSFQSADFALTSMSFQQDEGEYFSPTLQADVYHVQDPAILLQQSSDNLQFTSTSEQLDDLAALDDYATVTASLQDGSTIQYPVNQQLQAVLDSPLPEGLAEFSTYHSTVSENNTNPKNVLGFQKEYIMYANSPHVGLSAPSPLPSPLKYHDSPSFTYPTPPASHEAQSPSLSQGAVQSLPILSPSTTNVHSNDTFIETSLPNADVDEVRNTSSPLSAAFFTTTMSSAEEVEEALEEVLPGESIVHGDALDMYSLSDPSPPPQSPMCVTPLPSPLPNAQTNVTHSTTNQTFTPTTNITFQRQGIHTFQSHMMSSSEDPLLSSSPKDFGIKKKFEFGGYQSYKIISHGPIDVNNPNITGILVEANGEYKLIQAASNQLPMSWLTGATHQIIPKETLTSIQPAKQGVIIKSILPQPTIQNTPPHDQPLQTISEVTTSVKIENDPSGNQSLVLDVIKQEDVIKNETPGSPQHLYRKRPRSEASGYCFGGQHQSRLRNCTDDYFTPPPMLDPTRSASGLYNEVLSNNDPLPYVHQDIETNDERKSPRINVGSQFQASIPELCTDDVKCDRDPNYEHLLWDPGINDTLDDNEVRMFMELAMCAAMPVGGHTREHALQVLGRCGGDTHAATLQLMASAGQGDEDGDGRGGDSHAQRWSPDEVEAFLNGLREHDKNFYRISKQIGTKSSKQCIQFYYFWKKVTKDYKTLYLRSWSPEGTGDTSSSRNPWRWLSKGGRPPSTPPGTPASESGDEFPCKLCGKVFNKVKSRSAHMKSHRPQDADSKRPRVEKSDSKLSGSEERQHRDASVDNNHSKVQLQ